MNIAKKLISSILNSKSPSIKLHETTYLNPHALKVNSYPQLWKKISYKEYKRFPTIQLPIDTLNITANLFTTITKRSSTRKYQKKPLSLNDLSSILYYSSGIRNLGHEEKRMYPSGGARYPLEVYLLYTGKSSHLPIGVYHYNVKYHTLENMNKFPQKKEIIDFVYSENHTVIENAQVLFFISAVFNRTEIKYGIRAYRFIVQEVGHLLQNMSLVCSGLDIGSCIIGGYTDEKANMFLDLEADKEQVMSIMTCGYMTG